MTTVLAKFWDDHRSIITIEGDADDGVVHVAVPLRVFNNVEVGGEIHIPDLDSRDAAIGGFFRVDFG